MKKIAVVLSGCGNKDGAEITEAVSLIINLSQLGAQMRFFAPDQEFIPKNFLTNKPLSEKRNVMVEAARITRSEMQNISELNPNDFDGLAFPGGFGVAINLCDWGEKGAKCSVHYDVESAIRGFYTQGKPIAAICIAPALIARVLGEHNVTLTLGDDAETIREVEKTGAQHVICPVDDYITDREHKVITTPAYMYGKAKPHEVFKGISGLAKEFLEMA